MSLPTKGTRPLASSQFWAKHVKNCQQSLHSQARYCREHKLKLSTFRYWDRKLHHHENRVPSGVAKSMERPGSNFIDVTHIITHPNTNRTILKILYWGWSEASLPARPCSLERNGFALWLKRLEKGKYPWPRENRKFRELTEEQLKMLLDGIDFWNAYENLNYKKGICLADRRFYAGGFTPGGWIG